MFYSGASYVDKGDGTVEHNFFTKGYEEYTLFYRKLVEEGLMDPEAFTQTDPIAKEKSIKAALPSWSRTIRPSWMLPRSMSLRIRGDYIPLGPLERADVEPDRPVDLGIQGNNVTAITKNCKGACVDAH